MVMRDSTRDGTAVTERSGVVKSTPTPRQAI